MESIRSGDHGYHNAPLPQLFAYPNANIMTFLLNYKELDYARESGHEDAVIAKTLDLPLRAVKESLATLVYYGMVEANLEKGKTLYRMADTTRANLLEEIHNDLLAEKINRLAGKSKDY